MFRRAGGSEGWQVGSAAAMHRAVVVLDDGVLQEREEWIYEEGGVDYVKKGGVDMRREGWIM